MQQSILKLQTFQLVILAGSDINCNSSYEHVNLWCYEVLELLADRWSLKNLINIALQLNAEIIFNHGKCVSSLCQTDKK